MGGRYHHTMRRDTGHDESCRGLFSPRAAVPAYLLIALILALLAAPPAPGAEKMTAVDRDGRVVFKEGDRLLLEYRYGGKDFIACKPYVRHLPSPSGVRWLRDNVADHIHHHALMFAVAVDGVTFWPERKKSGRQVPQQREIRSRTTDAGKEWTLDGRIDWQGPGKKTMAVEQRTLQLHGGLPGCTLLTWRTVLSPPAGGDAIRLSGSHYYGLGARFVKTMDGKCTFTYADPAAKGETVRGDEKLTGSDWAACSGPAGGTSVTVALFDHPGNPRPALWFTMGRPFAYLAATVNLYRKPITVRKDASLSFVYGVAVWDGRPGRETVAEAGQRWLKLVSATGESTRAEGRGRDLSRTNTTSGPPPGPKGDSSCNQRIPKTLTPAPAAGAS